MTPNPTSQFHRLPATEDLRRREAAAVQELRDRKAAIANDQAARARILERAEAAVAKDAPTLARELADDWHRRWNLAVERAAMSAARNQIMFREGAGAQLPPGRTETKVHLVNVEHQLGLIDAQAGQPRTGRRR